MDNALHLWVNHRTAAVGVRERLAFADDEIVDALSRLKGRAPAITESGPALDL